MMKRNGGFTLVEILLALTLMGMLLGLAYGGLRASTRATDKGQAVLEESGRIRMAHQFVRKQINQMIPLGFIDEQLQQRTVFMGDRDKIRFVAPMPGYLGFGGPQVQELAIVQGKDGSELVLSHALLQGYEESLLFERDPILLMDHIESAEFAFLGRDETGELTPWLNRWDTPEILPLAVTLEIEFTEKVYIKWPPLTAAIRIDASALQELVDTDAIDQSYEGAIRKLINKRKQQ
ncbi:MAG: prepilin-type N-terminal cleavage/methylation domain-containing protein [Xanthomonadales bacterium]|nr:prepilin-type N-terminal cleavage/methylation domain-containing protein [Xanthomonadales bacterium]